MNARKIKSVRLVTDMYGDACRVRLGSSNQTISTYESFENFLKANDMRVKFSRRPFAGAIRETFTRPDTGGDFRGTNTGVDLCSWRCEKHLGVGKKTTKFSVWYKPV